ncbi:hypothetical protein CARUB_v10025640mg [Capsella rubella]|uniref:Inositol polyphosphate-related phosphatase domain-containing protein n=1 Tax=Capsella rubella TaxID=81985 RepID=R0HI26_9BRAS|nr:type I inositol polyphosphate 5-phosphatase 12 [Capsella rubella]EOA29354.1 hypothetical protein CARUB_v10025640mg [Capsella rubella]
MDINNNNHHRSEDDEEDDALSAMSSVPPPRKIHSYSHQLRATGKKGRHHRQRQHSLDDIPKITEFVSGCGISGDSSDDEFYTYATTTNSSSFPFTRGDTGDSDDYLITHQPEIGEDFQPLPEFVGSGGGVGMFKVPTRSPLHSARPPCLELRPHPLKETQVGRFLRNIACTGTQLWAGQESGVRFWNFDDAFEPGCGLSDRVQRGDEDAAPFQESASTSPTTCLMVDNGNRLVWSGHKDGKIRSWKMDYEVDDGDDCPFKEGLSWQAHKGPVNSVIMSSYGDLWSCSEGGVIKIWTWESMEKSLSLRLEEKHMAALLVERSGIDLRAQVTVNGTCNISSSEVKCLLADNVRSKVWAAQLQTFSLWDGRTKELLKVFNTEGQTENRVEMPSGQEQPAEDEMKTKIASTSKKEKPHGFLQRSRNAIMGAADAVRRVATRGGGAYEDAKRTEAMVLAGDGMIWTGCTNGLLIQWDGNGNRLQDFRHHQCAVLCFCTFGERIYIGYVSGHIQIIDLEGNLIAGWVAHNNAVIKMAAADGYIFSLATHGGIRGWHVISPGPLDGIIRSELAEKERTYAQTDSVRILIGSWNVGQGKASHDALMSWLGSVASDVGILVVGLQEVEMGAGFLAMSAAKESVGGNEGSTIGQYWIDTIGKTLDEKAVFERMGSRQLAGLLISLWVRKNLRTHVGDIDVAAVPCGFGRAIGNKGGVGLRIRVFDRIMCFINCHLAAHLEAVNRRNADFDHIYKTMSFTRSSAHNAPAAGVSTSSHTTKSANNANINTEETKQDLAEADMVVFFGDFNYRLFGISYDEARDFVSQRSFDWLREKDQLRAEMKAGRVFQGMREAIITFPPTYKFERHRPGLGGYDSGEKKRIPAWCDRVIYRDTRTSPESECSLDCPVVASIMLYDACMDVTDSDHKPVRCKFHVKIEHVDRSVRRQEFGRIIKTNEKVRALLEDLRYVPETIVSSNNIVLQNQDTFVLRITNKCVKDNAVFRILCEGQSTVREDEDTLELHPLGSFGFPRWLEVTPAAGAIKPDSAVEVSVHHEEFHTLEDFVDGIPQNWWCEDTRDKEAILVVNVQGGCSTETVCHRVHVRHCFSAKTLRIDSNPSNSKSQSLKKNEGDSKSLSSKKNEGDSNSKSQKKSDGDSNSKSQKKSDGESNSKSQKKSDGESNSKSQKKSDGESNSKSQKKSDVDSNSKSLKKSDGDSNSKSSKKSEGDTNSKSQKKGDGDSSSKSQKKSDGGDSSSKSHKKSDGDSSSKSQKKNDGDVSSSYKSQSGKKNGSSSTVEESRNSHNKR